MLKNNPEIDLIVNKATEFAIKFKHAYVTIEHLGLALISYKNFRIIRVRVRCFKGREKNQVQSQKTNGEDSKRILFE